LKLILAIAALPAEITEPPKNVVTTDGKSVTLQCRVFGAPKPLVRWLRNNQELTGGRFRLLDSGDLEIREVSFVDAGEYICDARNKFGNSSAGGTLVVKGISNTHFIIHSVPQQNPRHTHFPLKKNPTRHSNVFYPPTEHTRIVDVPEDYEVAAGTTATFRCSAVTDSTLTLQIDWLRNNQQIDFDAEQRYVKLQDNSLTIDKTTEIDSGVYTCVARTEYDNATASATLTVQDVPNRPELTGIECRKRDSTIRWKPMGDNRSPILHYTIQYNTSFTPDTWEVASKDVPATETSYTVSMSPWSNYTFRVIARNKIGPSLPSLHSETCTTTTDVPYKNPENVKGHGNRPNNLLISWTPMQEIDHNAPKFKYQVQWKPDEDSQQQPAEWQLEEIKDWRQSELIINDQPTYRPYKIRVRAINEVGESNVAPTEITGYSGQAGQIFS
jgi:neuronal cell adhesion protein